MTDTIGVFSGKGDVGKTTLVANLGASLTNIFNKNVVIVDTNLKNSHLGIHLGIYEDLPVTLREILRNEDPILHAVYTHPQTGIRVVPAPLSGDGIKLTKGKLCSILDRIKDNYDMVIIDTAPGLGYEFICAAQSVDKAIVITTPEITALTDAMKSIEVLKKIKKDVFGIVVNQVRNKKYELTLKEVESSANKNVIAVIHEDRKVGESIAKGVPVVLSYPHSRVAAEINKLAGFLIGEEYEDHRIFLNGLMKIFDIFKPRKERFENNMLREPEIKREIRHEVLKKEVADVEKLRSDLTDQVKDEIKKEIKERIKKRLMERMENG